MTRISILITGLFLLFSLPSFADGGGFLPADGFPHLALAKLTENKDCYEASWEYPVFGQPARDQTVRGWAERSFNEKIKELKKDCLQDHKPGEPKWTLDAKTEQVVAAPGTLSIKFVIREFTGGAHASYELRAMVLDKNGRELVYGDLFGQTDGLWQFLAEHCYAALYPQLKETWKTDPDWAKNGLAPHFDSFKHFLVTPEGLTLIFPPYQVASYAAGEQSCDIPWQDLTKFAPKAGIWK
jgi:hypothetical protein